MIDETLKARQDYNMVFLSSCRYERKRHSMFISMQVDVAAAQIWMESICIVFYRKILPVH